MADRASDSLPYGHLGNAVYSPDRSQWKFGRSTTSRSLLRPIGASTVIAKGTQRATGSHLHRTVSEGFPSRRRQKQARALAKALPEVQPALGLLPQLARVSEAVEDSTSRRDILKGQLIAIGKVYDESKRSYVSALAFPCGPTGSDLRIVEGLRQRQGWDEDRTSWMETSSYSGRTATWEGPGVSILSVVFAKPLERGEHYLAVRLQTKTLIFRPVLRKASASLEPNLVFSIGIDETGRTMHAHTAFNPWFTGQLIIVDQAGGWSVWESGRQSNAIKKINEGSLSDKTSRKEDRPINDGWMHASWVQSASTICIATRRKLVLIDLEAATEIATTTIDIGLQEGLAWILDIGTTPSFSSNLFVVTSSHILSLHIERSSKGELLSRSIAQVRHYRNPEDINLRMSICLNGDDIVVILRSALDSVTDQYYFNVSNPDVVMKQVPNSSEVPTLAAAGLLDFQIDPTPLIWNSSAVDFFSLACSYHAYALGVDLSVSQTPFELSGEQSPTSAHGSPVWTAIVSKATKSSKPLSGDLFANGDDGTTVICKPPVARYAQRRQDAAFSRSGSDWNVSYSRLMSRLSDSRVFELTDIDKVIEKASSHLRGLPAEAARPMRSLYDLVEGSLDAKDIDGASTRLEGLRSLQAERRNVRNEDEELNEDSQALPLQVSFVAFPEAHSLPGWQQSNTLSTGLEMIRQDLVIPSLDALVQSGAASRDNLARQMAAEITLASRILRFEDTATDQAAEGQSQNQNQVWDLSFRPPAIEEWPRDSKSSAYDSSSRTTTAALPTPSASASTVTGSSYTTKLAAPEVARLGSYATFSKEAPSALPRALNKVLAHWTVGTDPAEYNWQSTARDVSRRDEDADQDDMTEKERRQMQRRTERYIRRQRREAEESQRQQMLSSQAPEIVSASQPAHRPGTTAAESQATAGTVMRSSQSYGVSQVAASQVVPGRHGGRPSAKKKRKSGF